MSRPVGLVTGASSGIGAETAVALATRGFDVGLVGRDRARLAATAARCGEAGAQARAYTCDFAELAQVRDLAAAVQADWPQLDVLVNNAGLALGDLQFTVEGHEMVFAVNHLAPYLLTRLLAERLVASAPSRVVVVASDAYRFDVLDPDDWPGLGAWQPLKAYGRSKLCNVLFAGELARRLDGTGVSVSCVHPGFVATSLGRDRLAGRAVLRLLRPVIRSPRKGAETVVALATTPLGDRRRGEYFADGRQRELLPRARDEAMARRLWDDSAHLVGLQP